MTVSRETSDQARQARRERIAAGKADPDDLDNQNEIVCPYCGRSMQARSVIPALLALDTDQITGPISRTGRLNCIECAKSFNLKVVIFSQCTTSKQDGQS